MITESCEQVAEMHSMLAEYHRKLAKEARLDMCAIITLISRSGLPMRQRRFHVALQRSLVFMNAKNK